MTIVALRQNDSHCLFFVNSKLIIAIIGHVSEFQMNYIVRLLHALIQIHTV